MEEEIPTWKQNFEKKFWWTGPFSLVADILGIYLAYKEFGIESNLSTVRDIKFISIYKSDVVIFTGFILIFGITLTMYFSFKKSTSNNKIPIILGTFGSLFATIIFLRFVIGKDWWIWSICCIGTFLCIIIVLVFSTSVSMQSSQINSKDNMNEQLDISNYHPIGKTKREPIDLYKLLPRTEEDSISQKRNHIDLHKLLPKEDDDNSRNK